MAWQKQLQAADRNRLDLKALQDPRLQTVSEQAMQQFAMKVPASYWQRIQWDDPNDPLLRQVLAVEEELNTGSQGQCDAVGDLAAEVVPGVLHKYSGRVLLIATGACPIHCRYCFRRHFPYSDHSLSREKLRAALDYIQADQSIREVILSGGDPFMLSDQRLAEIAQALESIEHLKTLRVHTRTPIALPARILEAELGWFTDSHLQRVLVLHTNHAQEIDNEVENAFAQLRNTGAILLNQSVLLRGVNDSVDALCTLSLRLFDHDILPYYLHQLDEVSGALHFKVDVVKARAIHQSLQARLPGYLVPKLVQEVAGEKSKTLL